MELPTFECKADYSGTKLRLGDQLFCYDRARTEKAYAQIQNDEASECGCTFCLNFIANRSTVYPANFLKLLPRLGIDPSKEAEVYECGAAAENKRWYGGWFFLAGRLIEAGETQVNQDGIQFWIQDGRSLPPPNGDFGPDFLALNFTTQIPWVLTQLAE